MNGKNGIPEPVVNVKEVTVKIKVPKALKENVDAHLQEQLYDDFDEFAVVALREKMEKMLENKDLILTRKICGILKQRADELNKTPDQLVKDLIHERAC